MTLYWQFYTLPDRALVSYEGAPLFDTGSVSGDGMQTVEYSGAEAFVTVTVFSPAADTAWDFLLTCA